MPEPKESENNLILGVSHCNLEKRKDGLLPQDSGAQYYSKTWCQWKEEMRNTWKTDQVSPEEDGRVGYTLCYPRSLGAHIKL